MQSGTCPKIGGGFSGRGIVTTAGGPLYFLNAYLNIALLREKGCTLPVEWAYLGAEMKPAWIAEAEGLGGVRMIDLGGTSERCNKSRGGWQSKIRAVLASSFEDVLFLDADSFPRADPTFLFDRPEYTGNAAALWGDVKPWEPDRAAYLNGRFGITLPTRQCESGQLMVNKTRAAAMLLEVARLHQEPDLYRVIFGDKDSWMIAALRTGTPHHFQLGLRGCRGGIMQPDFDGNGFFAHLTNGKFQWDQLPRTNERALPGVGRMVAIQQELAYRLGGGLDVLPPPFTREGRRAAALVGRR
jgi:alpha 1,2-mannosyltransferase